MATFAGSRAIGLGGRLRAAGRSNRSKLALLSVLALLMLLGSIGSDVFLTWGNLENILVQSSIVGIVAVGMTMIMVSGGIDLSVGSSVSLSGICGGYLMARGWAPVEAIAVGVGVALLAGATAGMLAAHSRSHPFIVTLGLLTLVQGAALLVSNVPVNEIPEGFLAIVDRRPLGIPLIVAVFLVTSLIVHVVLSRTRYGRWLYALGGSESAARLAGIRVRMVKVSVYALSGLLVGIAAALLLAQLSSAQPRMGAGIELTAIAAVAVGGTPLAGGRGDVLGTILGVLLLGVIANALNLLSVTSDLQYVIQGAVIIVAVMAQRD